jgi:TPR repeat protein
LISAAQCFKLSADQGNAAGQGLYGLCLRHGKGISKDLAKAVPFFKLSADQGDACGQYCYGLCLRDGKGLSKDLRSAASYFKLSADQGQADGQWCYGICLRDGMEMPIDLKSAADYFQQSADRGNAIGQCLYGQCLRDGRGISINLKSAAHYFKLSADQEHPPGQYNYALCLLTGSGLQRDIVTAIQCFKLSADNGNSDGQAVVGWMTKNGINTHSDLPTSARYYELSVGHSIVGTVHFAQSCRSGLGIPIDFTIAAEFFQRAADSGNAEGENSFGCCLERGEGINQNIELAVQYYCKAASHNHPSGLYNFGRCLEYGRGIERDFARAAKYYRMAAEFGNPSAENSFGVCLERGIGVQSNQALAAHYFELSALHGDRDGANNLGFCLEHGRGVKQDIETAAEWYGFAAEHGHPEGDLNYQRCLRLLGHWMVPDRSSCVSDCAGSDDLAEKFLTAIEDPIAANDVSAELFLSIKQLKSETAECAGRKAAWVGCELCHENSQILLAKDGDKFMAVKTAAAQGMTELIQREIDILKTLNHPLVVHNREPSTGGINNKLAVVTDFVPNRSLADHLPDTINDSHSLLGGPTRITRIIAGIALAMRFLHSQNVIHCNLTPDNILLDWDWNVQICDFGDSLSPDYQQPPQAIDTSITNSCRNLDLRYLAPECYENIPVQESDVFSFGMILYELIIGHPIFPKKVSRADIMKTLDPKTWCPEISDNVLPATAKLIRDCLAFDYRDRPSFIDILHRLKWIEFKLIAGVNSTKITEFVKTIEENEKF